MLVQSWISVMNSFWFELWRIVWIINKQSQELWGNSPCVLCLDGNELILFNLQMTAQSFQQSEQINLIFSLEHYGDIFYLKCDWMVFHELGNLG